MKRMLNISERVSVDVSDHQNTDDCLSHEIDSQHA